MPGILNQEASRVAKSPVVINDQKIHKSF
jgi:hypothetical protein